MHQYCRAADVFQAGVQLHRRQCLGSLNNCRGLLHREGLRRPPFLALGSVDQGRDVARHEIIGFRVPDGALQREMPHGDDRTGVTGRAVFGVAGPASLFIGVPCGGRSAR